MAIAADTAVDGGESTSAGDFIKLRYGLTDNTTLNAVGDRAYANYDFWTIRSLSGTYVKMKTAQFRTDPVSGATMIQAPSTTAAAVR